MKWLTWCYQRSGNDGRRASGVGFDGNPMVKPPCQWADLSEECQLGTWDWVLSLEVGEHIPAEYERVFVENLHRHNRDGIILSWAVPGQGGFGHVNEKPNEDVIEMVCGYGYRHNRAVSTWLREVSTLRWFQNTLMLFERGDA